MGNNTINNHINNSFDTSPVTVSSSRTPINPRKSNNVITTPQLQAMDPRAISSSVYGRDNAAGQLYNNYNIGVLNPFASDYFDDKIWGINFGAVTDKHSNPYRGDSLNLYSQAADFEHLRRNEQSNVVAGLNLLNQYVGKTLVNGVGGIVAGFYGIGSGLANWDLNKVADNSVARAVDRASEWVDENNTIFTSQRGRDNGYFGMFSFETLKDYNDGLSFISGIVASEALMGLATGGTSLATGPGRWALKAGNLISKANSRLKNAVGVGSGLRESNSFFQRMAKLDEAVKAVDPKNTRAMQELARDLNTTVDHLSRYRRALDGTDRLLNSARSLVTSTFYEGGLEARHVKDEFMQSALEKLEEDISLKKFNTEEEKEAYRQRKIADIEEMANSASNATFLYNVGLLRASNLIQFPTVFGGSKKIAELNKNSGKFSRKALGEYVDKSNKAGRYFNTVSSILKNPVTEFLEETGQGLGGKTFKNFYEGQLGLETSYPELSEANASFGDAFARAFADTYGTKEGLYEGVIGALLGATGSPIIARNKKGKIRPKMVGGIYGSIQENRENQKYFNELKNVLNSPDYGTLLSANRDSSVLAALNGKRADIANLSGDVNLMEEVENDIIYQFVKDRLDKGVKDLMDRDVDEISRMDLDTYKKAFSKEESFTEEQMKLEKDNFTKKVKDYSDAYTKVFKGLEMDRVNNSPMTKKYFDILTQAVANEKIYNDAYNKEVDFILSDPNNKFTKEQIDTIARNTSLLRGKEELLAQYIEAVRAKKLEKLKAPLNRLEKKLNNLKEKFEEIGGSKYLLSEVENINNNSDLSNSSKEFFEFLKDTKKKNPELFKELDILEDINILTDIYNELESEYNTNKKNLKINENRYKNIRDSKKDIATTLKELNEAISKEKGESLEILTGKKDTLVLKDLDDYFELTSQKEEMFKNSQPKSVLDILDSNQKELKDAYDKISFINEQKSIATEIAYSLYASGNVAKGLEKVIASSLNENYNNINRFLTYVVEPLLQSTETDENILGVISNQLDSQITQGEKLLENYSNRLSKENLEKYNNILDRAKKALEDINKLSDNKEEDTTNKENNLKEQENKENQQNITTLEKTVENNHKEEQLDKEEESDSNNDTQNKKDINNGNKPEFDNSNPQPGNTKMTYTISQSKIDENTPEDVKNFNLKLAGDPENNIAPEISYNQGVSLTLQEENENTEGFKKSIELSGKAIGLEDPIKSYFSGKEKVKANPELLKEKEVTQLDPDVIFYIATAPIRLSVHTDTVEVLSEGRQDFDENSPVVASILMYNGLFQGNPINEEAYNSKRKSIKEKRIKDIEAINKLSENSNTEQQEADIRRRWQEELDNVFNYKGTIDDKIEVSRTTYNVENSSTDTDAEGEIKVTVITYKDGSKRFINTVEDGTKTPISEPYDKDLTDEKLVSAASGGGKITGRPISEPIAKSAQENKIDKINAKYNAELAALEQSNNTITTEEKARRKALVNINYQNDILALNEEYNQASEKTNDRTNFAMRATVLYNQLETPGGVISKARVGNFINGDIVKPEPGMEVDNGLVITSDNPNGFVENAKDLEDKIVYGTQDGSLNDISHTRVKLNPGSNVDNIHYQNGAVYYVHTTSNGQQIPLLLNSPKLENNPELIEDIINLMEQYMKEGRKARDIVNLPSNHKLYFLSGKYQWAEFFNLFIMKSQTSSQNIIDLNTLTVTTVEKENGKYGVIKIGNSDFAGTDIESLEQLQDEEFREKLRNALGQSRFKLNMNMLFFNDTLNEDAFKFVFENKLLTHHFNFVTNPDNYKDSIFKPERAGKENKRAVQIHLLNHDNNSTRVKDREAKISLKGKLLNLFKGSSNKSNMTLSAFVYELNSRLGKELQNLKYKNEDKSLEELFEEGLENILKNINSELDSFKESEGDYRYTKDFENSLQEDKIYDINKLKKDSPEKLIDLAIALVHNYGIIARKEKETILKLANNRLYYVNLKDLLLPEANLKSYISSKSFMRNTLGTKGIKTISGEKGDSYIFDGLENTLSEDEIYSVIEVLELLNKLSTTFGSKLNIKDARLLNADGLFINHDRKYIFNGKESGPIRISRALKDGKVIENSYSSNKVVENHKGGLQFGFYNKGEFKNFPPFTYLIKDEDGNYIKANYTDFKYENGKLVNGVIMMNTRDGRGVKNIGFNSSVLLAGENNMDYGGLSNLITKISLPFIYSNFKLNDFAIKQAEELMENFKSNSKEEEAILKKAKADSIELNEEDLEETEVKDSEKPSSLDSDEIMGNILRQQEEFERARKEGLSVEEFNALKNAKDKPAETIEFKDGPGDELKGLDKVLDDNPDDSKIQDIGLGNLSVLLGGEESFGPDMDIDIIEYNENTTPVTDVNDNGNGIVYSKDPFINTLITDVNKNLINSHKNIMDSVDMIIKEGSMTSTELNKSLLNMGVPEHILENKDFFIKYLTILYHSNTSTSNKSNDNIETIKNITNFVFDSNITEEDIRTINECK